MTLYYRDYGSGGQVVKPYTIQVPRELWPPEDITTEFVNLTKTGLMTMYPALWWDYASGPTFDFRFFPGYKKTRVPSLVHDQFCKLISMGLMDAVDNARLHADKFFYTLLILRKFWKPRAKLWYRGVRIGAKMGHKLRPVLEAP